MWTKDWPTKPGYYLFLCKDSSNTFVYGRPYICSLSSKNSPVQVYGTREPCCLLNKNRHSGLFLSIETPTAEEWNS